MLMQKDEWETGTVSLNINGELVEMQMTVPAKPVKPHRMLPIFHKMTNAFVDQSVAAVESGGETISCKAGCGACCRQPVPVSEGEIYQLAELVDSMPEPRRAEIKARFAIGTARLEKIGWFDQIQQRVDNASTEPRDVAAKKLADLALQYFYEGVACPFLENESCSIHQSRPLACREYLVTSPAVNCSTPTAESVKVIDVSLKASRYFRHVTATGNLDDIGFLPLIRALDIAENYPERFAEKTGREWMSDFFNDVAVNKKAEQSRVAVEERNAP